MGAASKGGQVTFVCSERSGTLAVNLTVPVTLG